MLLSFVFAVTLLCAAADAHNRQLSRPSQRRGTSSSASPSDSLISAAWYTGWHSEDFPLSAISWSKYTHLTYAFATTTPDVNTLFLDSSDDKLLKQFVAAAHTHDVKASLSVGGWTGSRWFSTNVGSAENRTSFVRTVTNIAQKYDLDGIDFDWEFPGTQGIGCNIVNENDTAHFLSFLQELRNSSDATALIISAATYVLPWADTSGNPSDDVSAFSEVLDYIAIMNYDIKSVPSIGAGSASPLDDSCEPPDAQFGSATSAVEAWTNAGFPMHQIVLGVPAYGHSFHVNATSSLTSSGSSGTTSSPYPSYNPNQTTKGDKWDSDAGLDVCEVMQGPGGTYTYWGLIQEGYLNPDGSVKSGIEYLFDNCSHTPFVYNQTSRTYISFDNVQSFGAKGNFINSKGLAGFAIWEAGGDYRDVLLDAIRNASITGDPNVSNTNSSSSSTSSSSSSKGSNASSSSQYRCLIPMTTFLWLYMLL